MEEIVNKVEKSGLIQLAITDFLPKENTIIGFDLAPFLWQNLVLREKEFRIALTEVYWQDFKDKNVFLHCSEEVIVPSWAYYLVNVYLKNNALFVSIGSKEKLQYAIVLKEIISFDVTNYTNTKIIVKGCSEILGADELSLRLFDRLQETAASLMFGEPCSAVPLFKKRK